MALTDVLATQLLAAREIARKAEETKKEQEAAFIAHLAEIGIDHYDTPEGVRISVEERPRRDFAVNILAEFLPVEIVAQVLKEAVDPKAFDNAVGAGLISPEIADKATTTTYSTQVRVYGTRVRESR